MANNLYFTFGRFQPPTIGHEQLITYINDKAKSETNSIGYIFVSGKINKEFTNKQLTSFNKNFLKQNFKFAKTHNNPLDIEDKIAFLKKMFPKKEFPYIEFINTTELNINNPFTVKKYLLEEFVDNGIYKSIKMIVGSDRYKQFTNKLIYGNDKQSGRFNVLEKKRNIVSQELSPRAMSGTKAREKALEGNIEAFINGVQREPENNIKIPSNKECFNLMNNIRKAYHIKPLEKMVKGKLTKKLKKMKNPKKTKKLKKTKILNKSNEEIHNYSSKINISETLFGSLDD